MGKGPCQCRAEVPWQLRRHAAGSAAHHEIKGGMPARVVNALFPEPRPQGERRAARRLGEMTTDRDRHSETLIGARYAK